MKLYSKDKLVNAVTEMRISGRMSHGFLLTGEKGVGKKTAALYIASALLCENGTDGVPCGECRHCRRIAQGTHPDVICPERSGKKMIYTKDTVRKVCSDAFMRPNDCDSKVYVFADCENIEENTQNLMLKLIEEPPDSTYFIFTAREKTVFLPTILSRVITFGIPECTESECREALETEGKYTAEQISSALEAYHGNIGCCKEYLNGGEAAENVNICRRLIGAMSAGNEYDTNKILYSIGDNRERLKAVLACADKVVRDVCVIRLCKGKEPPKLIGCCREEAFALANKLSFRKAEEIHTALCRVSGYCGANVNVSVAIPSLSGILAN